MKVVIFEACRSPEIEKVTEPLVLSRFFTEQGIAFEIYSNDFIWPSPIVITKTLLKQYLQTSGAMIVHLAMHGHPHGFVLKWSTEQVVKGRTAEETLTITDILQMTEWRGKLIVSGACETSALAPYFLRVGARGVIAPRYPIDWPNLGQFFCEFYGALFLRQPLEMALTGAISKFPEYDCYEMY